MDRMQVAPAVGIGGCFAVLAVLAAPYGIVETGAVSAVGTYYGTGAVNPLLSGLFAVVLVIVLAAGRGGRTDPDLAAGVALTVGVFLTGIAALWALTVPPDVALGMSTNTVLEHHRWVLVAVASVVPASAVWYARALGLL